MNRNDVISACLETHDCFYLYDEHVIRANVDRLRANFPQIHFLYSIKCNPDPRVLRSIFAQGFGADAASAGEVRLAREAGLSSGDIYYSAPGKSMEDIRSTVGQAVLIADSIGEIRRIQTAAEQRNTTVDIGVRINPDFTFAKEGGQPSKFGIDEDQALSFFQSRPCKNIHATGIHVHLKSQELSADVLAAYYQRVLRLAEKLEKVFGDLTFINMGSGMGIQYTPADAPLDVAALGAAVQDELEQYKTAHPRTKIIIEVGRYAVCESGVYVTKVMDRKVSHGKTYLILKNTLNGFIRPSLAQLVSRYSPQARPTGAEPLFTAKDAFEFRTLKKADAPAEVVTLVGNLCTGTDVIAEDLRLARLECGDAVIITHAGAYAAALSPVQFSAQDKPKELFLTLSGEVV